jgi:hypothetical protein
MAFATGVFNTTVNPAELNVRSFAGAMLRLFPNGSFPLWGLLSQQPRSRAKNFAHGYFSKTFVFGYVQINHAAYVAGETALVVDSTTGILPFMILYNPTTRENMRVTTVDSATQITVVREFGRVATANIADDQKLLVVGSAFAEGSARPEARRITTVHIPNYTQIFRNAWAVTDTARASLVEAGFGNVQEDRRDCAMLHSVECESAIFFGQAELNTAGAQPIHTTQGIYDAIDQYVPANTNTAGPTTTFDELVALVEPAFQYSTDMGNAKERVAFVGSTALKVLNDIGRLSGQVTIMQDETSFGMQFTSFKFYKGKINLIEHPLFNGLPELAQLMVIVDLAALKLAFMDGRDTKAEEYGGEGKNNANGVDAVGGSLTSEFAVELINPYSCAVVEGLTAAAV